MATTYDALVSGIQDETENNEADFVARIPSFIDRAESRVTREIDLMGVVFRTSVTVTASQPMIPRPAGALYIKTLNLVFNGSRINLQLKTDEAVADYWPDRTSTKSTGPLYYAHFDASTMIIAPCSPSTVVGEIAYVKRPATLSTSNQSNFLTEICDEALFNAAMVNAAKYMKNDVLAALWEKNYQTELVNLLNLGRRERRDDLIAPFGVPENTATGTI